MNFLRFLIPILLLPCLTFAFEGNGSDLMRDLMIVDYWNQIICDRLPVTYNNLLQGGYFAMPSARMGADGSFAFGYSSVPPYRNWNLKFQLTDRLEISGNYRIFTGVDDPILSPLGFGDFSDKGANFKLSLFQPEDSDYKLPGIAFGMEDFMGTRNFKAQYLVLTQVFLKEDLEVTLGVGGDRIRGWFGGLAWLPFRKCPSEYLQGICFTAEYDATPYKSKTIEKHPDGRQKKSPINFGVKYRLWDTLDFSLSYMRGCKFSWAVSTFYNFGDTDGFITKVDDPLPYTAPVISEPIGYLRPETALVQDLVYAYREQNLEILNIWLGYDECQLKTLTIKVVNDTYRTEGDLRARLNNLVAYLTPNDIEKVVVIIDAEGFPVQQYSYPMDVVRAYAVSSVCDYELDILTPIQEAKTPNDFANRQLFIGDRPFWSWYLMPKTHTFFGSAKGKFKYSLGASLGFDGFFKSDIYYSVQFGYTMINELYSLHEADRLNPSQLIQVRTDVIKYYKQKGITLDEAYLQKSWNMGCGWYSRLAGGYFEEAYGGLAGEALYYPVNRPYAIGAEAAIFKKRSYEGWGVTSRIRKLHGFTLGHKPFPFGSQFFLNLYYDWYDAQLDFRVKIGKFLANDYGARYEVSRYYPSGVRITLWYTHTNGHDHVNGSTYYDKGIAFSLPLDMFYKRSSKQRWGYGMSAWLRDVGVMAETGEHLYEMINDQRQ